MKTVIYRADQGRLHGGSDNLGFIVYLGVRQIRLKEESFRPMYLAILHKEKIRRKAWKICGTREPAGVAGVSGSLEGMSKLARLVELGPQQTTYQATRSRRGFNYQQQKAREWCN